MAICAQLDFFGPMGHTAIAAILKTRVFIDPYTLPQCLPNFFTFYQVTLNETYQYVNRNINLYVLVVPRLYYIFQLN